MRFVDISRPRPAQSTASRLEVSAFALFQRGEVQLSDLGVYRLA